ncbi:hypothetical protein B566_EDAN008203 [Ephemera danica]|nr:hypothetical protein B566_EDAN008203 [Ephemera danica]
MDGKTWPGRISECAGGVGRNLAEAIGRLQLQQHGDILKPTPLLLSSVGRDRAAQFLLERLAQVVDVTGVQQVEGANSAAYEVLLDSRGECRLVVGDVEVHNALTKHWVKKFERNLTKSPLVVLDGNTPTETMHYVLQTCQEAGVPGRTSKFNCFCMLKLFTSRIHKVIFQYILIKPVSNIYINKI